MMRKTPSTSTTEQPAALPPKVQALEEAANRIREFKTKHRDILGQFEGLVEDYNQKLEDAEKEARAIGQSSGPFLVVGTQVNIDEERLFEELGPEDFAKVGGVVELRKVFTVDKQRFGVYAESGLIPREVLNSCYEKKPKFKTPKKVEIP